MPSSEAGVRMDWTLIREVGIPAGTLVLGVLLDRLFERRPKLVTFYGHVSTFKMNLEAGGVVDLHAHSIIVRNSGRVPLTNVRIGHPHLPDFQMYPEVSYTIVESPSGSKEILLAKMPPGEQVTISYLYFPPITFGQINNYVKADEGQARVVDVLLTPQLKKGTKRILWALLGLGAFFALYLSVLGIQWVFADA